MNEKQVANEVILASKNVAGQFESLKKTVRGMLLAIAVRVRELKTEIKTEKDFLNVVAELIDAAIVPRTGNVMLDIVIEQFDGIVARQFLRLLDKYVLDRFLGADWFDKLMMKADEIIAHRSSDDELFDESSIA